MNDDRSSTDFSRREFTQLLAALPLTAVAAARPPQQAHNPEENRAADEWRRKAVEIVANFDVPVSTEPGFVFRA